MRKNYGPGTTNYCFRFPINSHTVMPNTTLSNSPTPLIMICSDIMVILGETRKKEEIARETHSLVVSLISTRTYTYEVELHMENTIAIYTNMEMPICHAIFSANSEDLGYRTFIRVVKAGKSALKPLR